MTDLNNIGDHIEGTLIAESQATKATTSNSLDNLLSDATQLPLDITITGNRTLTDDEFFGHIIFDLSGSPAADFSLFLPNSGEHWFIVRNNTGKVCTVDAGVSGGTVVELRESLSGLFHSDGTSVISTSDPDIMKYDVGTIDETADYILFWDVNLGKLARVLGEDLPGSGGGGGGFLAGGELLHMVDEKASGTAAANSVAATWNTRVLNTTRTSDILGASLSSNQITLPAGTYYIEAVAPGYIVGRHKLRLRNITDVTTELIGESAFTDASDQQVTHASLFGKFTLSATKTLELQHYTENAATSGLGIKTSASVVEVYAEVRIWRDKGQTAAVQTTDATQTVIAFAAMTADSAHTVKAWVQGREDATGDTYHAEIFAGARNEGGTSTAPTPNVVEVADAGAAGWDATLEANDTSDEWEIKVTGEAAHTIDWTVTYFEIVQEV